MSIELLAFNLGPRKHEIPQVILEFDAESISYREAQLKVERIMIALRLFRGEHVLSKPQDISIGRNYRFKDLTYEKQYHFGKILLDKEHISMEGVK